jgi:hypothetical protein
LIDDPAGFDGVQVIDVDEHLWRHVLLAGQALNEWRRWVQQAIPRHRGRKGDPHYAAERTLHTGADLLTDRQKHRLAAGLWLVMPRKSGP